MGCVVYIPNAGFTLLIKNGNMTNRNKLVKYSAFIDLNTMDLLADPVHGPHCGPPLIFEDEFLPEV